MNKLIEKIQDENLGEVKENVSFRCLTTFKAGGIARCVVYPSNIKNLQIILKEIKKSNINYKIFGNGSNILASDKDYEGIIIKLSNLNELEIDDTVITVQSGYSFMRLANDVSKKGLSGLEWACGIPGTVGGAVYMNAGAYLSSLSDVLVSVKVLNENFEIETLKKEELDFSYRHSRFMNENWICLEVTLKLIKKPIESVMKLVNERKERRIATQPLDFPSAGSVFRNPENDFAGRLIEESLLKGMMIGGAQISDKHANFIINRENATSSDIKDLIDLAKDTIKERYDIDLLIEQELFNWE